MTPSVYTAVHSICRDFVYTFPCRDMGVNGRVYGFVYLKRHSFTPYAYSIG
jgi:hypothetical protein